MLVGVPVSLAFMVLVVAAQVMLQWINWTIASSAADTEEEKAKKAVPTYWKYIPGVINSILIIIFGQIYKRISARLV
jgi:hypothetical protein